MLFASTAFCILWLCVLHSESQQSDARNASTHRHVLLEALLLQHRIMKERLTGVKDRRASTNPSSVTRYVNWTTSLDVLGLQFFFSANKWS